MSSYSKKNIILITGYLGFGKTTLLNELLQNMVTSVYWKKL
ncbi:GTP-binding protein [Anaerocolumna chitinilytica]